MKVYTYIHIKLEQIWPLRIDHCELKPRTTDILVTPNANGKAFIENGLESKQTVFCYLFT